ncbi:DUF2247 family protein [Paenarthrobacter sp. NPDC089675]|uniref:DUF2247 family protein n=1 Tax=Paenarthrobacter sp. NPDC089675 TaxID=3364376 RepID=UPI0038216142
MNEEQVEFLIPWDFIAPRVTLTPEELVMGYHRGWINSGAAVALALEWYQAGRILESEEEALALLLSNNLDRVPDLIGAIRRRRAPKNDDSLVWQYLTLAWIHEHQSEFIDLFVVVEMLWSGFGYPESWSGLIRYLPPPLGEVPLGVNGIMTRWRIYIESEGAKFRNRPA